MGAFAGIVDTYGGRVSMVWEQGALIDNNKVLKPSGVCSACAMIWIKQQKSGRAFYSYINSDTGKKDLLYIARLILSEQGGPQDYMSAYLKDVGLTLKSFQPVYVMDNGKSSVSMNKLTAALKGEKGYYVISIYKPDKAGHAIAANMYHNRLFDPNYGAAQFDDPDSLAWALALLLRQSYGVFLSKATVERYA